MSLFDLIPAQLDRDRQQPHKWEWLTDNTYRMRVQGGWIYCRSHFGMVFVPDAPPTKERP